MYCNIDKNLKFFLFFWYNDFNGGVRMKKIPEYAKNVREASDFVRSKINFKPKIAIVLGSGLDIISQNIESPVHIDYSEIPHFEKSTAPGHKGELIVGKLGNDSVILMNGRHHYYEGYTMKKITFSIRVMQELGVEVLMLTNACGGLNPGFKRGDIMLLKDIINFMGDNPLIGPNFDEWGPRFPDMSNPFDNELNDLAKRAAQDLDIDLKEGVYIAVTGPSFETPAELKMFQKVGADAVGMSTVPEVIVARHAGIKVLAISCITDMALPDELEPLTSEMVNETSRKNGNKIARIFERVIEKL